MKNLNIKKTALLCPEFILCHYHFPLQQGRIIGTDQLEITIVPIQTNYKSLQKI